MGRYGTTRRHIAEGAIAPLKLHNSLRQNLYVYERFNYQPQLTKAVGYGAPTGVTGDENLAVFKHLQTAYHVKGAGQTILGPVYGQSVQLLDVTQDLVAAEGSEHYFGAVNEEGNPLRFYTGNSSAPAAPSVPIRARLKFKVEDVSEVAECAFGLHVLDAGFTANLDDYTDLACLNLQAGVLNLETILNNAATVTTPTGKTWLDQETHELMVQLVGRSPRFFFDGQEVIKASTPYEFKENIYVAPFFFLLNGTTPQPVAWEEFEFAHVDDIDDTRVSN